MKRNQIKLSSWNACQQIVAIISMQLWMFENWIFYARWVDDKLNKELLLYGILWWIQFAPENFLKFNYSEHFQLPFIRHRIVAELDWVYAVYQTRGTCIGGFISHGIMCTSLRLLRLVNCAEWLTIQWNGRHFISFRTFSPTGPTCERYVWIMSFQWKGNVPIVLILARVILGLPQTQ